MANTNHTVDRLNRLTQQRRISAHELDPNGPALQLGRERLLVGDEVVTRRNQRTLRTDRGIVVKNRDHWTIEHIHPDGAVTVTGRTGTVRLPADYVAKDLELGYAQTSHATQGRTVDVGLLLVDGFVDSAGSTRRSPADATPTTPTSSPAATKPQPTSSPRPSSGTGSNNPPSPDEPGSESTRH